jgi:hypothetical protein
VELQRDQKGAQEEERADADDDRGEGEVREAEDQAADRVQDLPGVGVSQWGAGSVFDSKYDESSNANRPPTHPPPPTCRKMIHTTMLQKRGGTQAI